MFRLTRILVGEPVSDSGELPSGTLPPGVVIRRGRLIPWLGGLIGRLGGPAAAVTLRRTIVVGPDVRLTPALIAHELTHVRQWEQDRFFPVRYSVATLRHGYHNNPYEVEARAIARVAADPRQDSA